MSRLVVSRSSTASSSLSSMSHWDSRMVPSQCRLSCSKGSALGSGSNRGPSAPPPPPPSSFYPPVVLRLPPPSSLVILNARSSSLGDAPCRGHADAPPSLSLVVVPPPPPSRCCRSSSPATTSDVVPPERYGLHRHNRQQQRPRRTVLLPPDALGGLGRGQCRESVLGGGRPRCRHSLFSCNVGSCSPFKNLAPLGSALLRDHLTPSKCARKDYARSSFTTSASTCILALG